MQTQAVPIYPYSQYLDNDPASSTYVDPETQENIGTFFAVGNQYLQDVINWFSTINLPVYDGLSNGTLSWVAAGVYGVTRPSLVVNEVTPPLGALATAALETLSLAQGTLGVSPVFAPVSDDVFKRILTWAIYKGDNKRLNLQWLKRRIARFVGTDTVDTEAISIGLPNRPMAAGPGALATDALETVYLAYFGLISVPIVTPLDNNISITITTSGAYNKFLALTLQSAIQSGIVEMPLGYNFTVTVI